MAGYIFNLNSEEILVKYIKNGVYSTILSPPKNEKWATHHEATFADYVTMKPGDNVYFFIQRKIYGIGELVSIEGDCKYLNYPEANQPFVWKYQKVRETLLWDEGEVSTNQRWVCFFKPSPCFFKQGIDMDDILSSNPRTFRMLRAFWKLSFVKVDDDENQALIDVFLRQNRKVLDNPLPEAIFNSNYSIYHEKVAKKIKERSNYKFRCAELLESCMEGNKLLHEMALEAGLLFQISNKDAKTVEIFGEWDYLSHQVIASPFKPIDYMDKMDIFGYAYIKGFNRTKSEYIIIENKKDIAILEDIEQLMKYVDWVKDEYTFGNYSLINAFLVAYEFNKEAIENCHRVIQRNYTIGRRPVISETWSNLKLVKYRYMPHLKKLTFEVVFPTK